MVAALPITAYSFRTKPSEIGLKPLGENPGDPSVSTAGDKDEHTAPEVNVGWSRIKKSPAFWLLVVAFLFMGLVNGAILPNQVTNMTSVTVNGAKIVTGGHDPVWAGTVLSAYMVTVVIAKISLGVIYNRFGLRFGNVLGSVACIIACVALCFPATDLGSIVAAVSFGVGTCMGTITPTIAASKQFGMADLGKVTGTITSLEMVGGTVGAIVSGVLFDATGIQNDPFSSVPNRSCDSRGGGGKWIGCSGGTSGRTSPHTLVRSDAPPLFVFVPYNDPYL